MGTPAPGGGTGFTASQMASHASGITPAPAPKAAPTTPAATPPAAVKPTTPEVPIEQAQMRVPDLGVDDADAQAAAPELDDGEPPDPWTEDIHGMTAKDLLAAIKEGKLPDALLDSIEHEYGDGEDKTSVKLREALAQDSKERMQLRDYHRRVHEVTMKERDLVSRAEGLQQAITALDKPETLYEDLMGLGVSEETLQAAAYAYAQQRVEYGKLPPHMRKVLDDNKRARIEAAQMRNELNQLKQRERSMQTEQQTAAAKQTIRAHGPVALLKHGLNPQSKLVQEKLGYFLDIISQGKPWTKDMIFAAAEATKQDVHALEAADKQGAAGARTPQGKPLAPSRAAATAPLKQPAQGAGRGPKGFTPSAMAKLRMG